MPPSASSTRISRLCKALALLAGLKLAVLLGWSLELPRHLSDGLVPEAWRQTWLAPAAEAAEANATKKAKDTAKAEPEKKAEAPATADAAPAPATNATAPATAPVEPAAPPPPADVNLDWKSLKKKEEELQRKELALKNLEHELDERLTRLTKLEAKIKTMLDEAQSLKDAKFRHLIDVYANMKSQQAAQTLENLDEDTAVKILAGLKGRQAGEILNFVSPKKGASLSRALSQMQANPLPGATP